MEDKIKQLEEQIESLTKEQHDILMQGKHISEKIKDCQKQIDTLNHEDLAKSYQSMIGKYYLLERGEESFKSHSYFYVKDVIPGKVASLKCDLIKYFTQDGVITSFSYITDNCLPATTPIEDFVLTSCDKFYEFMNFFDSIR